MRRALQVLAAGVVGLACAILPAGAAAALDPADALTLGSATATQNASGPLYSGYPITFHGTVTGDGTDTTDAGNITVVYTPPGWTILTAGCPADLGGVEQSIDLVAGSTIASYSYEADGGSLFQTAAGTYTFTADANQGPLSPTITAAGQWAACAYLTSGGQTLAVSPAPLRFTITNPGGSGGASSPFGGPPGKTVTPSDLILAVKPSRTPIRSPGNNLITVTGAYNAQADGAANLILNLKSTSAFNGCAAGDEADGNLTRADGGVQLTGFAGTRVTPNAAGRFSQPVPMNFRKHVKGTLVLCAYLTDGADNVFGVGFLRFTTATKATKPKHKKKKKTTRRVARRAV